MDNPRVLLTIALSFIILLMWQSWTKDYGPAPEQQQATESVAGKELDAIAQKPAANDMPSSEITAKKVPDVS
ncbi:hypothetical protein MNBD_GAMMA14-800, partial [hydrothermal vent metagenome]